MSLKKRSVDFDVKMLWLNISSMYNQEAEKYGLTLAIAYILIHIQENGCQVTDIAPKVGMEASSITRLLNNIEDKGWIVRKRESNKDRRKVMIYLTEEGKYAHEVAKQKVIHFNKKLRQIVGDQELENFFTTIDKINGFMQSGEVFDDLPEIIVDSKL